ncbi:MAG: YicC family protein [Gammaproteobacteria bacterium]|nr:YicC family protein [Gammaproteobacteria bacterium]
MTNSMTAFSRQQADSRWGTLTWEIRSVNHRYLEASVRLPENFRGLENLIREKLRQKLKRGKVDCQLHFKKFEDSSSDIHIDKELVKNLVDASSEIHTFMENPSQLSTIDILRWPGVITDQKIDTSVFEEQAGRLFDQAIDGLISARKREGGALELQLSNRIGSIKKIVSSIKSKMPEIIFNQRQALLNRLTELRAELDPMRIEQEIVLLAQKADVDEELDRLDSHLHEVERVIVSNGQKGRRLDFLMQELNREANTLSSKAVVADTTLDAVELKVLIEQMREQIQNIE